MSKFQAGDVLKYKGRSGFEHHRFEVLEVHETDEEYLIRDVTPESQNIRTGEVALPDMWFDQGIMDRAYEVVA